MGYGLQVAGDGDWQLGAWATAKSHQNEKPPMTATRNLQPRTRNP